MTHEDKWITQKWREKNEEEDDFGWTKLLGNNYRVWKVGKCSARQTE